jgi:hypothetical protein
MVVSFIDRGNQGTWRKPLTCFSLDIHFESRRPKGASGSGRVCSKESVNIIQK